MAKTTNKLLAILNTAVSEIKIINILATVDMDQTMHLLDMLRRATVAAAGGQVNTAAANTRRVGACRDLSGKLFFLSHQCCG